MNKEKIIEGNKLIGVFMGIKFADHPFPENKYAAGLWAWDNERIFKKPIQYDTSWGWLMPVVKKIWQKTKAGEMPMETNREYAFLSMPIYTPISEVWMAVVEFIKWYNTEAA